MPPGKAPRVQVEREGKSARFTLREPREPLAWSVGTVADGTGPLRVLWHSERAPGAKARPAERVATLAGSPAAHASPLFARVWYDDGRVGQTRVDG
jgi:hypothetical protein